MNNFYALGFFSDLHYFESHNKRNKMLIVQQNVNCNIFFEKQLISVLRHKWRVTGNENINLSVGTLSVTACKRSVCNINSTWFIINQIILLRNEHMQSKIWLS